MDLCSGEYPHSCVKDLKILLRRRDSPWLRKFMGLSAVQLGGCSVYGKRAGSHLAGVSQTPTACDHVGVKGQNMLQLDHKDCKHYYYCCCCLLRPVQMSRLLPGVLNLEEASCQSKMNGIVELV